MWLSMLDEVGDCVDDSVGGKTIISRQFFRLEGFEQLHEQKQLDPLAHILH